MKKITMMSVVVAGLLGGCLLSGCAEHIAERDGAQIQVVPVTYSLGVTIKKGKQDKAREQLDNYAKTHWDKVTTQMVNLVWYTKAGKMLANNYADYLLEQGVDKNKLTVTEAANVVHNQHFDLKFETIVNRTIVEVCGYEKIGNYGQTKDGCYADAARWQSMVNPEKMLRSGD